jgi:hypothetical protein
MSKELPEVEFVNMPKPRLGLLWWAVFATFVAASLWTIATGSALMGTFGWVAALGVWYLFGRTASMVFAIKMERDLLAGMVGKVATMLREVETEKKEDTMTKH